MNNVKRVVMYLSLMMLVALPVWASGGGGGGGMGGGSMGSGSMGSGGMDSNGQMMEQERHRHEMNEMDRNMEQVKTQNKEQVKTQNKEQVKTQDKDQVMTQDKDQDMTQDKDQDMTQDKDQDMTQEPRTKIRTGIAYTNNGIDWHPRRRPCKVMQEGRGSVRGIAERHSGASTNSSRCSTATT